MNKNPFSIAEGKRVQITNAQTKQIKKMYNEALADIKKERMLIVGRTNISSIMREIYLNDLQNEINNRIKELDRDIESLIKSNMKTMCLDVLQDNTRMLSKMGFSTNIRNLYISNEIVNQVTSGELYKGRWTLSKAIWSDSQKKINDIDNIIAKGIAMQKSTYEIAKDLEAYVDPRKRKDWAWSKVYPNTNKVVDYNAQRLARTMTSHAYQYTMQRVTEKNPFIDAYKWNNGHSHTEVCPDCIELANSDKYGLGAGVFPKGNLPLDHPNGKCFVTTVMSKSLKQVGEDLADWVNGEGDDKLNSAIDDFVNDCYSRLDGKGVTVQKMGEASKILDNIKVDIPYNVYSYWDLEKSIKSIDPSVSQKELDSIYARLKAIQKEHKLGGSQDALVGFKGGKFKDKELAKLLSKYYSTQANIADDVLSGLSSLSSQATNKAVKSVVNSAANKSNISSVADAAAKYGNSKYKSVQTWMKKIPEEDLEQIKKLKESSGMGWNPFYEKYFKKQDSSAVKKAKEVVKAKIEKTKEAIDGKIPHFSEWVDICKKNTERHMLDLEKVSMQEIGDVGIKGLVRYTGSSYDEMNTYLRYLHKGLSKEEAERKSGISSSNIKMLKNAMDGLNNTKTTETFVVRRGSSIGDLAGVLFPDMEYREAKQKVFDVIDDIGTGGFTTNYEGSIGSFGGFTSTSSLYDRGFSGDVEYMFYIPEGTNASSIMSISQFGTGEGETLLNVEQVVKFHGIEESDGHKGSRYRVFFELINK